MTKYNLQECCEVGVIAYQDGKEYISVHCRTHDWHVEWAQACGGPAPWAGTLNRDGEFRDGVTYMQNELIRKHKALVERYRKQAKHVHAQVDEVLQRQLDENGPEIPELLITVAVPPAA